MNVAETIVISALGHSSGTFPTYIELPEYKKLRSQIFII